MAASLGAVLASGPAWAEAASARFSIPSKPVGDALIDFAVQAGISIGGTAACRGHSPALSGRMTVPEGLARLLARANCRFELVDAHTVRILAAAPAPVVRAAPPPVVAKASPPPPGPPEDGRTASEVVVTTTKRATALDRLPYAVSTVGSSQLDDTGAIEGRDAVRQLAGVAITNLGSGRDKILIRGLSDGAFTGRTQSTVGTYLDEVPINYNAPDPDLRLADVDSVEVLRGPQGALYGGGSLSGVFRVVTRKPEADRAFGRISALTGFTPGGAPSWQTEGLVNTPLGVDGAAVRAVAYYEFAGGYLDDIALRQSNVDHTTRAGGRMAVTTRLGPDWSLGLSAVAQTIRSADTQYVMPSLGALVRANRVRETHDNDFDQAAVTLQGHGDWGRFESSTGIVRHAFASRYDASAALSLFDENDGDIGIYDEPTSVRMLVEDAVYTSPDKDRLKWLFGVFASESLEHTHPLLAAQSTTDRETHTLYQEDRDDTLTELATYGEVSYALDDHFTIAAGMRAFRTTVSTRSQVTAPPPGESRAFNGDAAFESLSPKVVLSYERKDLLLYTLASQGYRAGGFNTGGITSPAAKFNPDSLWNFEVGAKASLFNGRLKLRTAIFYDLWTDIQTDQYFHSGLSYTTNVGDGRSVGWETELTVALTQNLSIQTNALLNDSELTRSNPSFPAAVHFGLPGVPDASMGALALYERPLNDRYSIIMSAGADYIGRSRLTFDPTLSPEMGGYTLINLSAQLKTARWRLSAFVSNPANVKGDTFAYGNPFSFGQVRQVTPQRPRTFSLALGVNF